MLCQAAGSLKKLKLVVEQICPSVALANVFDHEPLEELILIPFSNVVVSSAYSPSVYVIYIVRQGDP